MEPILAMLDSLRRLRPAMIPLFLLTVSVSWSLAASDSNDTSTNSTSSASKNCMTLNRILLEQSQACRCFDGSTFVASSELDKDDGVQVSKEDPSSSFWIGCSRDKMPAIVKALMALPNETNVTQLWIWDGLLPSVPARSFATIRPRKLIIERCHTGMFVSKEVFAPLADRLIELELKSNVLSDISADLLAPLRRLVKLDLSVNMFSRITNSTFGKSLPSLRSLSLYRNQIDQIADGALDNLQQLRSLNLANNRLTRITAATFRNLRQLEHLNLENNQISEIDENAFLHLTNLRVLNLGGNRLKSINFPAAMPRLRQLFLNNNTIQNLDDIRMAMDGMPALETLHLDQNQLKSLKTENENGGLKRWPTLQVLSLASNQLSGLEADDFVGLKQLRTLSLQGNQLTRLGDDESGPFSTLDSLTELFLSRNQLTSLRSGAFDGLSALRTLTVAWNKLETVDEKAFNGLKQLEKLFLNDNNLKYVDNSTFEMVQSTLKILDLSDNPWHCDCKLLWLVKWVSDPQQNLIVNGRQTTCFDQQQQDLLPQKAFADVIDDLTASCDGTSGGVQSGRNLYGGGSWDPNSLITTSNNVWITVLGIVLGVVSICILLAVSYLYFQDTAKGGGVWRVGDSNGVTSSVFGRWTASGVVLRSEHALRRVPSDMVNLIPKYLNPASSAASTTGEKM